MQEVWTGDLELDPALEDEFYEEPPELKERLDVEMNQESTGLHVRPSFAPPK